MWTLLTIWYICMLSICFLYNFSSVSWLFRIILILTLKLQPRSVLKLFLRFGKIWGSCSYRIVLIKKSVSVDDRARIHSFIRISFQFSSFEIPISFIQKFSIQQVLNLFSGEVFIAVKTCLDMIWPLSSVTTRARNLNKPTMNVVYAKQNTNKPQIIIVVSNP